MPRFKEQEKPFLFRKQDFYKLRNECLAQGKLFEDPEFPADNSSLFFHGSSAKLQWKRPSELVKNPMFICDGGSRFDIKQGDLGDCWFLAGLASLTLNEKLFQHVVPHDQSFTEKYTGIFHFRIWQYGKWIDVVVDDRLPTNGEKLVYLSSSQKDEFWSALLEKAYAKLNGQYEAIEGGYGTESLEDFSGGIAEEFFPSVPSDDFYNILLRAHQCTALITAGITVGRDRNLPSGHEYSVTKLKILDEKTKLIRVRNPWGNKTEWKGKWSDESSEWERIPKAVREEIGLVVEKDGEFWMDFGDFVKNFDDVTVCHLNPWCLRGLSSSSSAETCTNNSPYKLQTFMGVWAIGVTAGGSIDQDTFWKNPQFLVTLEKKDGGENDEKCTLIVALMQKKRRIKYHLGKEDLEIGFYLFKVPEPQQQQEQPKPLPESFFKSSEPLGEVEFTSKREVIKRFSLSPGTYCVVPTTYYNNTHGRFMLRFFTDTECKVEEYDCKTELCDVNQKVFGFPKAICLERNRASVIESQDGKMFESIFKEESGRNGEVGWSQLLRILQKTVRGDLSNTFTKTTVRTMIGALDTNKCGRINFEEFKVLLHVINNLMMLFKHYDQSNSGYIGMLDLREILRISGYVLGNNILSAIDVAYGTADGKIALDDYIIVSLKLKTIIGYATEGYDEDSTSSTSSSDDAELDSVYDKEWLQMLLTV